MSKTSQSLVTGAAAWAMLAIGSAAHAAYDLSYVGQDVSFSGTLVSLDGGHSGFSGSTTDQTWGGGNSTSFGGWLDFDEGGTTFGLEGGSPQGGAATYYTYEASAPFFTVTPIGGGLFDLSGFTATAGHPEIIDVTNVAVNDGVSNPYLGDTGVLTITVPEPAAWGLMLVGFGGVGAALRRRAAKGAAAI